MLHAEDHRASRSRHAWCHPPTIGVLTKAEFRHALCRVSRPWKPAGSVRGQSDAAGLQLPAMRSSPMERWYPPENVRHWRSLCLHPPYNGCPSVGVEGVSNEQASEDTRTLPCGRFQVLKRERSQRERKRVPASWSMKREEGTDGTRREGRFVNAEIGRAAPRREPSADSQSRCERSKERNGCFTLYVWTRFEDVYANRVVSQRYRVTLFLRGLKMHENMLDVGRRTTSMWVKRSKTVTRVNSCLSLKTYETESSHGEFTECLHGRDYKAWKEGERIRRLRNWYNWRLNVAS